MTGIFAFSNSGEWSGRQHNGPPNIQNAHLARPSVEWGEGEIISGALISYQHYSMSWQLVLRIDVERLYHKRQRNASLGDTH